MFIHLDNMVAVMGGEQSIQTPQSVQSQPAPHDQPGQSQRTVLQHRQTTEQSRPDNPPMVPMHNLIVNQSPVLPFPMLPQDAEVYLSLSDTPEASLQKFSNQ